MRICENGLRRAGRRIPGPLFAILCQACGNQSPELSTQLHTVEVPATLNHCKNLIQKAGPLEKRCIHDHGNRNGFLTGFEELPFTFVTGENVNLRERPSMNSSVIKQLPITARITVLFTEEAVETVGSHKGRWSLVYVQATVPAGSEEPLKYGWIFDSYIATRRQFERDDSLSGSLYCSGNVDSLYCVRFGKGGTAEITSWEKESGLRTERYQVFRLGSMILLEGGNTPDHVMLTEKNKRLRSEIFYGGEEHDSAIAEFMKKQGATLP